MPKIQTEADKARLAEIHRIAAVYATEKATAYARHKALADAEIEAVRRKLAEKMWQAKRLGTADAWIREASGISGFYQTQEMYKLGEVPEALIEVEQETEPAEAPRLAMNADGSFTLTITREEFPSRFRQAHDDGDTSSAVFDIKRYDDGYTSPLARAEHEGSAAYLAFTVDDELKKEVFEWASQHAS